MSRAPAAVMLVIALMLPLRARAGASEMPGCGSALAYPLTAGHDRPELLLAQRVIERRWGPADDSTYRELTVSGWKSEGGAFAMSMALPGAGQLYTRERTGYLFLLAEAVGFYEVWVLQRSGGRWDRKARAWAGSPNDSLSLWSFQAYEYRTHRNTADLKALYAADPGLFYFEIARDENLKFGWEDYTHGEIQREQYIEWRENSAERYKRSRYWRAAIWFNHTIAAFDALRAARLMNLPLRENLQLRLKSSGSGGSPGVFAALERKF